MHEQVSLAKEAQLQQQLAASEAERQRHPEEPQASSACLAEEEAAAPAMSQAQAHNAQQEAAPASAQAQAQAHSAARAAGQPRLLLATEGGQLPPPQVHASVQELAQVCVCV